MLNYFKLIFIVLISCTLRTCSADENAELCFLDTIGLIEHYDGYETETNQVITDDGYIITVHCLWNTIARNYSLNPVIAWHGLSDASHGFVLNYRNQSLGFLLADQGYFVCLPNARGNGYSQDYVDNTRNSNIPSNPYWRFSWDQIAQYDVPAVVDAVLEWTNATIVIYIGHSQGTTTMFALLASKPLYNAKISIFVALAPVVYFSNNQSPEFQGLGNFKSALQLFYGTAFVPHTSLQALLLYVACSLPTELCEDVTFYLYGYSTHTNEDRLPVYLCHSPTGYAWGQLLQYLQHAKAPKFGKYDFGWLLNLLKYGQTTPPQYDLTKVSAPVALYHSDADLLTNDIDVQKLVDKLPHLVRDEGLDVTVGFNHLDYVWAVDVYELVYSNVIDLIKDF